LAAFDSSFDRPEHALLLTFEQKREQTMSAQRLKKHLFRLLLIGVLLTGGTALQAADFIRMESSYLGDGWFEYRVTMVDDPYYETASIGAVSIAFPGRTDYGTDPADWVSDGASADLAIWNFDTQQTQTRPYERTFLARSSYTTFKTVDQTVRVFIEATPQTELQTPVAQVAVILRIRGVVPCPPGEADGSAAVQSSSAALREDLRIASLTVVGGVPTLSYEWAYDSTVSLEASSDLKIWTPVTTILGDAGETIWTATVPLENSGKFYRLTLLANEKLP
jgi:hypothetical protein